MECYWVCSLRPCVYYEINWGYLKKGKSKDTFNCANLWLTQAIFQNHISEIRICHIESGHSIFNVFMLDIGNHECVY